MNSTTTNIAVPRLSTVLSVGSVWLTAFTLILAIHLTNVTSTGEFLSTLIATVSVAVAAAVAIKAAVMTWQSEKSSNDCMELLPSFQPCLGAGKTKAA